MHRDLLSRYQDLVSRGDTRPEPDGTEATRPVAPSAMIARPKDQVERFSHSECLANPGWPTKRLLLLDSDFWRLRVTRFAGRRPGHGHERDHRHDGAADDVQADPGARPGGLEDRDRDERRG